jgi:enterochelin esterase-like enzyme
VNSSFGNCFEGEMAKTVIACAVSGLILFAAASTGAEPISSAVPVPEPPESPRIAALADAVMEGDAAALGRFWREMDGKTPLVEPIADDPKQARVTFVWRGTDQTKCVFLIGGLPGGDETLDRLEGTDLWYLTERIPVGARFGYMFLVNYPKMVPGRFARNPFPQADPLNPSRLGFQSIAELAQAAPQPWIKPRSGAPRGRLDAVTVESPTPEKAPPVWVYTPSGYDPGGQPCALLIAFDGEASGAKPNDALIPIPTIVENLIAAKKIPSTVVVLIGSGDQDQRNRNLRGSDAFANYLANVLLPWVRSRYRVVADPARTVIAGQSYGGLAAAHAALRHSDVFGCVLSQSGSFWFNPTIGSGYAATYDTDTGWLTRQFAAGPRLPLRFYVEVGLFEQGAVHNMVLENRRFRDVLEAKRYPVTYSEYLGGHDYCCWRGSFADGLVALLGNR